MAQWIRRVPTEHEIPGSSPGRYIFWAKISDIYRLLRKMSLFWIDELRCYSECSTNLRRGTRRKTNHKEIIMFAAFLSTVNEMLPEAVCSIRSEGHIYK